MTRFAKQRIPPKTIVQPSDARYLCTPHATLNGCVLIGDFSGYRLDQLSLQGCDCSRASFSGANFFRSDLRGATFRSCRLIRARLDATDCRGADFSGAVLTGALFTRSLLFGASFVGAHVEGADWSDALGRDQPLEAGLTASVPQRRKNGRYASNDENGHAEDAFEDEDGDGEDEAQDVATVTVAASTGSCRVCGGGVADTPDGPLALPRHLDIIQPADARGWAPIPARFAHVRCANCGRRPHTVRVVTKEGGAIVRYKLTVGAAADQPDADVLVEDWRWDGPPQPATTEEISAFRGSAYARRQGWTARRS